MQFEWIRDALYEVGFNVLVSIPLRLRVQILGGWCCEVDVTKGAGGS